MKLAFWCSLGLVAYVYVGYAAVLEAWAHLGAARRRRRRAESLARLEALPAVSIVLAVRNEGGRLAARLDNLLAVDYPADLREIIVVSDGSTDGTGAVLDAYIDRVAAIRLPAVGKASALNAGVAEARHAAVVFADARQDFAPDALRQLVAPLADPDVGGVCGELVLDAESAASGGAAASSVAESVGLYWRYEKWLRQRESDVGSTIGATGAIYALRRSAWRPLPAGTLLDDVLAPMRAVLDGRRVVFAPRARAYDRATADAATERRRKIRTLAGNYQLLRLEPRLLLPIVNPVWLQFVSHKIGRLVVPYALVTLLVTSAALAHDGLVYGAALTFQVAFYVLAAHGAVLALDPAGAPSAAVAPARGRDLDTRGMPLKKELADVARTD
jgi:biofilm PGA synthesis N-glycosyltransferase PgaC